MSGKKKEKERKENVHINTAGRRCTSLDDYVHTHTRARARAHALTHIHTRTHKHKRTHTHIRARMCANTHTCTRMHAPPTHAHTHARTHARTHRHTPTHTNTYTFNDASLSGTKYDKAVRYTYIKHAGEVIPKRPVTLSVMRGP